MDIGSAFKSAIAYRLIAIGALSLGLGLVAVGFLVGFGGAVTTLIADPLDPGPAVEQANPTITIAFCVLAVVVWQFGKTYALFLTLPRAAGRAAARRFDPKHVSSAVTADLDERLSAIEADVAETRRAVEALERDDRVATYDEDDLESTAETETSAIERSGDDASDRPALSSGRGGSQGTDSPTGDSSSPSGSAASGAGDRSGERDPAGDGADPLADDAATSEETTDRN